MTGHQILYEGEVEDRTWDCWAALRRKLRFKCQKREPLTCSLDPLKAQPKGFPVLGNLSPNCFPSFVLHSRLVLQFCISRKRGGSFSCSDISLLGQEGPGPDTRPTP